MHKLKSSSGNLGANVLAELCIRLESQARTEDLAAAEQLVRKISREYDRVQAALRPLHGATPPVNLS